MLDPLCMPYAVCIKCMGRILEVCLMDLSAFWQHDCAQRCQLVIAAAAVWRPETSVVWLCS